MRCSRERATPRAPAREPSARRRLRRSSSAPSPTCGHPDERGRPPTALRTRCGSATRPRPPEPGQHQRLGLLVAEPQVAARQRRYGHVERQPRQRHRLATDDDEARGVRRLRHEPARPPGPPPSAGSPHRRPPPRRSPGRRQAPGAPPRRRPRPHSRSDAVVDEDSARAADGDRPAASHATSRRLPSSPPGSTSRLPPGRAPGHLGGRQPVEPGDEPLRATTGASGRGGPRSRERLGRRVRPAPERSGWRWHRLTCRRARAVCRAALILIQNGWVRNVDTSTVSSGLVRYCSAEVSRMTLSTYRDPRERSAHSSAVSSRDSPR